MAWRFSKAALAHARQRLLACTPACYWSSPRDGELKSLSVVEYTPVAHTSLVNLRQLVRETQSSILASGRGQHTMDLLSLRELHVITGAVTARGENAPMKQARTSFMLQYVRQSKATARTRC